MIELHTDFLISLQGTMCEHNRAASSEGIYVGYTVHYTQKRVKYIQNILNL